MEITPFTPLFEIVVAEAAVYATNSSKAPVFVEEIFTSFQIL